MDKPLQISKKDKTPLSDKGDTSKNDKGDNNVEAIKIFKKLKTQAQSLLNEILPTMEELTKDDNYILDEVVHITQFEKEEQSVILEWMRDKTLSLIKEAECVKNEIDLFTKAYQKGEESIEKNMKKYPFLANVWYGDEYDKEGLEGLEMLIKDLTMESENVSESKIIEMAVNHFSEPISKGAKPKKAKK